jgi:serine/threonine protein kinase, bacterial
MIDSIAPTTLIQDRYYVLRVLRPLEFGWLYSVVDRALVPAPRNLAKHKLPLCFLEEFRVPDSLMPHLDRLAEQLRLELRQVKQARSAAAISNEMPDYDEVIIEGDRLFLKQFYVDHFSYGQVLEDRALTGEGDTVLSESEAWELLDGIEPIIKTLHRQGISHDNLSPETIVWQMADQKPGLMHFGALRSVIQRVSAPMHSLDFEASVLSCPMQTDWVNLAETTLVLLGDPDWNTLSLQLAQRLRRLLEISPQSQLPSFKAQKKLQSSLSGRSRDFDSVADPIRQPVQAPRVHRSSQSSQQRPHRRSSRRLGEYFKEYLKDVPTLKQDPMLWGMGLLIFGLAGLLGYRMLLARSVNPTSVATDSTPAFPLAKTSTDPSSIEGTIVPELPQDLKTQLQRLQVQETWFASTIDEMLGQSGVLPEDDRWKSNSKQLTQALEKLTPEARQNIGSYRRADFDNWLTQSAAKSGPAKPISTKQIEAQTDEQFFALMPDRKGKALNPRQLGQVWYAIARQVLK